MAKFVLLYHGGYMPDGDMPESEDLIAAEMAKWNAWFAGHGSAILDFGNPFSPVSKTISSDVTVNDGGKANANGFSILEAGSIDEAVEMTKGHPHLAVGGDISVYEAFDMR